MIRSSSALFSIRECDGVVQAGVSKQIYSVITANNLNMDKRKVSTAAVSKVVMGRKVAKTRQGHSKIFKNLSEFPIEINLDKENLSIGSLNRPQSSLADVPKHALRIESAMSHYPPDPNRKRLSLDSTNKKHERESLLSRNSVSKKGSRQQIIIDDTTRIKLAEDRRKYNISCGSVLDDRRETKKKLSQKPKRPSINNLHQPVLKEKSQPRREGSMVREKSKSRSRNKKGRKQSTTQLDKSKASTTAIAFPKDNKPDRKFLKKKQSLSTAAINVPNKEKKKRPPNPNPNPKRPLERIDLQDNSQAEYPINKYEVEAGRMAKVRKGKRQSGSRRKKAHSVIQEIDYASCINIPSNSSGLIKSISRSSHQSKIKIIDNWEFRYFADEHPTSLNLEEIRYFQQQKVEESNDSGRHYRRRRQIEAEISEDYPNFSPLELTFLASVMFIQRKWREHRLYRQIFSSLLAPLPPLPPSDSKQLNISANPPKSAEKTTKHVTQSESAQNATSPFSTKKEKPREEAREQLREEQSSQPLHNKAYLQSQEEVMERRSRSSQQFCLKSQRYQFLESEIFPNVTYLLLKKEQLREELHRRLHNIAQLQQRDALAYEEGQQLRGKYEREYEQRLQELNRSKHDIKKGFLRFIDTCKDIRHQALRRVSSESGLMAALYSRLFHLDQHHIATPSSSSDSMRRLSRKVLIRKEFYHTQKIEPFIYHATQLQEDTHLSARLPAVPLPEQPLDLSARCFRSRRERRIDRSEVLMEMEGLGEGLEGNRIREGCVVSPQVEPGKGMTLSFSKSDELLPLTLRSPRHEELPQNHERKERLVLEEVIACLTHELYTELVKIDDQREALAFGHSPGRLQASQGEVELQGTEGVEGVEGVEERLREIYKIQGLRDGEEAQRKHRNSKEYNISPASSQRYAFDGEDVTHYAQAFVGFLRANGMLEEIMRKLNKNQGFMPLEYLKFLRDFEIPEDEYDPLISNQAFIDWEDSCSAAHYDPADSEEAFVSRQALTIFHRCIFEAIIFLLEEFRPCGEKGLPFPWEKVVHFPRAVTAGNIDNVLRQVLVRLGEVLRVGCGIIDEKYIVYNEEDLERIHEENEDKIINMLERELALSPHNWYEVEEHCLEIKLELECEIIEYLLLEALDEVLDHF